MLVSRCASKPPVQFSATAIVSPLRVNSRATISSRDHSSLRKNAIGKRNVESLHDFVEDFLRLPGIGGPNPQMNLNFSRSGQNRGLHISVAAINRRDALLDVRFTQACYAQLDVRLAGSTGVTALRFARPGPPREMRGIFESAVGPRLARRATTTRLYHRELRVTGLGESHVEKRIAPIYKRYDDVNTTVLTAPGIKGSYRAFGATMQPKQRQKSPRRNCAGIRHCAYRSHFFSRG